MIESTGNSSEKVEWHIKPILFGDPYAMVEKNWGASFGALLFVGGIFAGFRVTELFLISFFGLFIALGSIYFRARMVRKNWKKVVAQSTDMEWKRVLGAAGQRGEKRWTWVFQPLCEFELNGKRYTVTPAYWSTFISESRLQKFLNKNISSDGKCYVWVNPQNPLQTEFFANDVKDFLLH